MAMKRSQSGMSITELMVATVLIGYTLAVLGELVYYNTLASTKLTNKIDGQVGCSRALRRISEDIRQARIIGNIYSKTGVQYYANGTDPTIDLSVLAPTGGFPAAPWPTPPYSLGPQTLIIQQPVLFSDPADKTNPLNGFPVRLKKGDVSTSPVLPSTSSEYVDTVIYHLVPSTQSSGQYDLQVARFSGLVPVSGPSGQVSKLRPLINPPQTVLTGIVGPLDPVNPGSPPVVFQYLTSPQDSSPITQPDSTTAPKITGVSINVEVQTPTSNSAASTSTTPAHLQAFLKNSRLVRLINDNDK